MTKTKKISTFLAIVLLSYSAIDLAKKRGGTVMGITDAAFALSGFFASTVTGYLVQVTGSFNAAFGILAVLALSSVLAVFFFHHPEKISLVTTNHLE